MLLTVTCKDLIEKSGFPVVGPRVEIVLPDVLSGRVHKSEEVAG
jgi:hypothetical protein